MHAKKKLIARLALVSAAVLGSAALVGLTGLFKEARGRERFAYQQDQARKQRVETSRAYLAELAKRVDRLPVDPTLPGEIESRYFEDQADGPFYVWAMDTRGDFLFGVPRSAFNRVNEVYEREVVPRLKQGVFVDRQTFLLNLVDDADELAREEVTDSKASELVERGQRFRLDGWEPEQSFVLSAPLKGKDGAALGSLYLKRLPARERTYYLMDPRLQLVLMVAAGAAGVSGVFLWLLLPTWVYVDARERGVRRAPLFAFLTVISSLVGLVVYLIARPEDMRRLSCPGCGREVNGGAYCPHCGRDLSAAFCAACRYPLKPEWAFCPACRAEIKPQAVGTPLAGGAEAGV
jgi:hypothetical protein